MPPKGKTVRPAQENISLGPQVREGKPNPPPESSRRGVPRQRTHELTSPSISTGELVFGVARIFASFNDTFVHVTDLRFVSP